MKDYFCTSAAAFESFSIQRLSLFPQINIDAKTISLLVFFFHSPARHISPWPQIIPRKDPDWRNCRSPLEFRNSGLDGFLNSQHLLVTLITLTRPKKTP